jgi:hypothetical protein
MGLFSKIFLGTDLDAEQAKSDAADARLRELNQAAVDRGVWTPDQKAASDARIADQAPVTDQVDQAFSAGWKEGAANVSNTVANAVSGVTGAAGDLISAPLGGLLRGIPWWLWIVGLVAGAAYLGLLPGLLAGMRSAIKFKR